MAQLFALKRSHRRLNVGAAPITSKGGDLYHEAVRSIPVVVAHLGLSAENEAMLRDEVNTIANARVCVAAIARSLVPR